MHIQSAPGIDNLGYTDGVDPDLDMIAIERAAKQQEGFEATSNLQKKKAVRKALGIESRSFGYRQGRFKQPFDTFLKSNALNAEQVLQD
jgi:hypothetical protein